MHYDLNYNLKAILFNNNNNNLLVNYFDGNIAPISRWLNLREISHQPTKFSKQERLPAPVLLASLQ